MQRLKLSEKTYVEGLKQALAVLRGGGLVIYPTETCYGVAADATNQAAIDTLLAYKTKRADKALSVAVTDKKMAERYVEVNDTARNIYDNFLPGPITVVSKGKHKLARGVESSMGTQGIRIPAYPWVLDLVKKFGKPITATSANASYKKTPYTIEDILKNTTKKQQTLIDLAIDAGTLPKRKPSTVVDTTLGNIHILREGSGDLLNHKRYVAKSLDDTKALATTLLRQLKASLGKKTIVFLLQGDLGAGKTYFSKFLAAELGVTDMVVSPTFTLCAEYQGKVRGRPITLQHMDTYRMYEAGEIDDLRPTDIFRAPNVVVIEWANKVRDHVQQYLADAVVVDIHIETLGDLSREFLYSIVPSPNEAVVGWVGEGEGEV